MRMSFDMYMYMDKSHHIDFSSPSIATSTPPAAHSATPPPATAAFRRELPRRAGRSSRGASSDCSATSTERTFVRVRPPLPLLQLQARPRARGSFMSVLWSCRESVCTRVWWRWGVRIRRRRMSIFEGEGLAAWGRRRGEAGDEWVRTTVSYVLE